MSSINQNKLIKRYRATIPFHFAIMVLVTSVIFLYLLSFIVVQVDSVYHMLQDTQSFRKTFIPDVGYLSDSITRYTGDPELTAIIIEQQGTRMEKQMDDYAWFGQLGLFISLLIHVPILFLWLRQIIKEVRQYSSGVRARIIFEPKKCVFIKDMVERLCLKMGVDPQDVVVMSTLQPLAPFVTRWKGKYHLVLSAAAIDLAAKDPEMMEAVLAHELGHVLQHDANLGRWCRIILAATQRFILLDFIITTLTLSLVSAFHVTPDDFFLEQMGYVLYFLFWSSRAFIFISLNVLYFLIPFFIARFLCLRIIRRSEYLADKASLLLGGEGEHLARALLHFAPEKERRVYLNTHPEMSKRLERVNRLLRRLSNNGAQAKDESVIQLRLR